MFRSLQSKPRSPRMRILLIALSFLSGLAAGSWLLANDLTDAPQAGNGSRHVTEGYALLEAGQSDDALAAFQTALSEDKHDLSALLGKAMIHSERQEYKDAFSAYTNIVQIFPEHAFAWNRRGLAAFNLEDFDEALNSFERATVSQPVNGFFYESLAWTHMCRGEFTEAAESAKTASLMYNREGENAIYPLLIAYFAYLESEDPINARRTLAYAIKNRTNTWPAPVVAYLADQITESELISYVTDSAEETEAHTYIGLKLKLRGDESQATQHLEWVARKGNPRVFEYTLARSLKLRSSVALMEH